MLMRIKIVLGVMLAVGMFAAPIITRSNDGFRMQSMEKLEKRQAIRLFSVCRRYGKNCRPGL